MLTRFFLTPLVLAGALLGSTGNAFAQSQPAPAPYGMPPAPQDPNGPPDGRPGQMGPNGPNGPMRHRATKVQRALRALNLSGQQRAQIQAYLRQFREARQSGNPEPRRIMIGQIKSVLTPQQQARFVSLMHRSPGAGPQGQYGPNGPQGQYGPNGPQGQYGPNGPQGQYGPNGPQGQYGPNGPQGQYGPNEPQGPNEPPQAGPPQPGV